MKQKVELDIELIEQQIGSLFLPGFQPNMLNTTRYIIRKYFKRAKTVKLPASSLKSRAERIASVIIGKHTYVCEDTMIAALAAEGYIYHRKRTQYIYYITTPNIRKLEIKIKRQKADQYYDQRAAANNQRTSRPKQPE